ncbi:putative germin-like protein 2-1 isoform X2 [Asparagus officinalis]|uniref:putative germin-like protein 2-1 isoform X2 n=1 Tax=Asparagus officinalis TaxID=4686 RepID=UPI00098DEB67|nr:putative germin-like protein 2-1 isoform X2 [Asparagus officinalis]
MKRSFPHVQKLEASMGLVFMNGFACKDPTLVTADDFFYSGLNKRGNTSNPVGSKVTLLNADKIPGLNTFGISMARVDFIPGGLNPPHTHPRATEILTVIQGKLFAGFVTVNPDNKFYSKVLKRGDVFVFPQGLIHFQINIGRRNAAAIVGLSSQNPGVNTIANAMFGARPEIPSFVLAKGFQTEEDIIRLMQSKF